MAIQVSGTVIDSSSNKPLANVNITTLDKGISTNSDGFFEFDVPLGTELTFTHIGFKSITLKGDISMIVKLKQKVIKKSEIVVSAGLSDESLNRVSSSLTVFSKSDLKNSTGSHFQNLTHSVSNLNWAGGTSRPRYFQIRGVGERSHYFGEGPPNFSVGFTIDDIELSGLGMVASLHDLEQIEIFKGPQSTVFGSNASAGLINIKTNEPVVGREVKISFSSGNDNLSSMKSIVNLAITDGLQLRFSLDYLKSNGFRKNEFLNIENSNKRDELISKFKLKYKIRNNLDLLLTVLHANMDNGYDVWSPDNNSRFITYSDTLGKDKQNTLGASFNSTYKINSSLVLKYISSFSSTELEHSYDGDWANEHYWLINHGFDSDIQGYSYSFYDKYLKVRNSLTNEFRLSKDFGLADLIGGIYAKSLKEEDEAKGYLFGGLVTNANSIYDFKSSATYMKFNMLFNENFQLDASLRIENTTYQYDGEYFDNAYYTEFPLVNYGSDNNMLGSKISLTHFINSESNYFISFSKGFKSGGINQEPLLSVENRKFGPEEIYNIDGGYKYFGDNQIHMFNLFYTETDGLQVNLSSQQDPGNPNSFFYFTNNAGSSNNYGLEIDSRVRVTNNVELTTNMGYLETHTKQFKYLTKNGEEFGGNREAAMAPKLTFNIGMNFSFNDLRLFVNNAYKSPYYFSDSHDKKSGSYNLTNLNVQRNFGKIDLKFWVNNLFDIRYETRAFYFGLIPLDYSDELFILHGDPLNFGITLDYSL